MNKPVIQKAIDSISESLKTLSDLLNGEDHKEPDKLDRPKDRQVFWFVDDAGSKESTEWTDNEFDQHNLLQGNCFWGDGAEERCKEYQKALHTQGRIRALGGKTGLPDCAEWGEWYYHIKNNIVSTCMYDSDYANSVRSGYFYFETREIRDNVISTIGQESLIHMVKNGVAL